MTTSRFIIFCIAALSTSTMQIACAQAEHKSTPQEERTAPVSPLNDIERAAPSSTGSGPGNAQTHHYKEISHPTPNYDREKVNEVQGIILHHTAEPTVESSLNILTSKKRGVGTHVVIDTDGTRYVMCSPTTVTFHAGASLLDGRTGCNNFTIGIEFQGNTLEHPLTENQIYSAIEYMLPIIDKYHVPLRNIVTHEMIRTAYKKAHPGSRVYDKVDITPEEYQRFMKVFNEAWKRHNANK